MLPAPRSGAGAAVPDAPCPVATRIGPRVDKGRGPDDPDATVTVGRTACSTMCPLDRGAGRRLGPKVLAAGLEGIALGIAQVKPRRLRHLQRLPFSLRKGGFGIAGLLRSGDWDAFCGFNRHTIYAVDRPTEPAGGDGASPSPAEPPRALRRPAITAGPTASANGLAARIDYCFSLFSGFLSLKILASSNISSISCKAYLRF